MGKSTKPAAVKAVSDTEQYLTAEDIIGTEDLEIKAVGPFREWGNRKVLIKLMSANEAERWAHAIAKEAKKHKGKDDGYDAAVTSALALIRQCAVNPDGSKMFTTSAMLEALAKKSMRAIRELSDCCILHNGLQEGMRRQLALMLRTRAELKDLGARTVEELNKLAGELDGETVQEAVKNA